jgi:hypothetical protein
MRSKIHKLRGKLMLLPVLAVVYIALLVNCVAYAATKDNELKAAYIARFTEFIEWPAGTEEAVTGVFTICVFGDHPIQSLLDELPRLMSVDNQPIEVNRIDHPELASACKILFVPAAKNNHIPQIYEYISNKPVLVINEVPDVDAHGQLISLYKEGNRLRILIHLQEAQAAGFIISSRLLKLANVVE